MPPCVTVVVLSYNRPDLLERALASIAAQTYPRIDVLLIDNPSPASERVRGIAERFGVPCISNDVNTGFTGGMNLGIAKAAGEYIYLTEDDIELAPDCVARLVECLRAHPEVALAGPVMWNKETPTVRCAGGVFTLGGVYAMHVAGAGDRTPPAAALTYTKFLPGSMIAARTEELRDLGGFHPDFFMYGEDVELCARVAERGRAIAIVPGARVEHVDPPSAPVPPLLRFHKQKNLIALYLLHAPIATLPEFVLRYAVIDGLRRLARDRRGFIQWLRAWIWAAGRAPALLSQRARRTATAN